MTPSNTRFSVRRFIPIIIGLVIVGAFAWTLLFLYNKSKTKPIHYETEAPFRTTIVKKTVATGAIVPRQEVEIKPRVSGVVSDILVEPGAFIERDQLIARIQIVPDVVTLNRAESSVQSANITFNNAKKELARYKSLYDQKIISETEYRKYELDFQLARQELSAARSNLQLVKEGASASSGKVSNEIRSTVNGMILDVPIKVGASVIESNNFNPGTTIAFVADMDDMIFEGKVDESEVGKIKEGMSLSIKIGAVEKQTFEGTLEYIAPKGVMEEGAIQFAIKAAIVRKEGVFIRANYSANADIVLDKKEDVLAIAEAVLQFDEEKKPYVEVEIGEQEYEKRYVEVGLSDGINIEIVSGVDADDKLKKPTASGK